MKAIFANDCIFGNSSTGKQIHYQTGNELTLMRITTKT